MKIIISPYSRMLRNGQKNPKNYPWFAEVVKMLKEKGHTVVQVGVKGEAVLDGVDETIFNASLKELSRLIAECDKWCSVDNFFQHLAHLQKKQGVVLFGQSNPEIFGHSENKNLYKNASYFKEKPFDIWEAATYKEEAFVPPETVVEALLS